MQSVKTCLKRSFLIITVSLMVLMLSYLVWGRSGPVADLSGGTAQKWVGTWSTAPQRVEPRNMPPEPGLSGNILRQIVRVSLGGDSLRMKFSNGFSTGPARLEAVAIAISAGEGAVDTSGIRQLTFNGKPGFTMAPGSSVTSDPIGFSVKNRQDLAITIRFGDTPAEITGHPGSRTTSYLAEEATVSDQQLKGAIKTDHWYFIQGIDVKAPESAAAIAIIGNSITDGRGSGTNKQNRWPDILSERLLQNKATEQIAVLNQGIGGNAVLQGGLGPTALKRFNRDILEQSRVKWLIIMEGVNDLGGARDSTAAFEVARGLIAAYEEMIDKAHSKGIKVYGGTITPIKNSFYYKGFREAARDTVNDWIRNSGRFDAVIDFDRVVRNPRDTLTLLPEAQSGDYLHPNELGYRMMGNAIDLELFE